MSLQVILIVGNEPERVTPLAESMVQDNALVHCRLVESFETASAVIHEILPDLVLVMADAFEAESPQRVVDFCRRFREDQGLEHRPILVLITGTSDEKQRIEYFVNGADDIFPAQLGIEEIRVRLLAHLRRNLDLLSNRITQLPGLSLLARLVQRKINQDEPWALMTINLNHFDVYAEVYGQIPADQVLRTFSVMLGTLIRPPDFIGHVETDIFAVLTHPDRAERLAEILCRQFETVAPNFYSERDKKRGYIIAITDDKVSRKVRLIALGIGIVNNTTQQYLSYKAAFMGASEMMLLARSMVGNQWVSDRLKLTGASGAAEIRPVVRSKTILVIETDAALAFLLKTTLEMQGYEVETVTNRLEATDVLQARPVHLILMDAVLHNEPVGWELCQDIKQQYPEVSILFMSTIHDREKALASGADLYLPKPFELIPLFTWVDRLLKRLD
ncbi:MAG: response regulator [Candidatus Melainabacteria bacterium]|nr:response regulator [Candidatus Melainabacteria bacterium]